MGRVVGKVECRMSNISRASVPSGQRARYFAMCVRGADDACPRRKLIESRHYILASAIAQFDSTATLGLFIGEPLEAVLSP